MATISQALAIAIEHHQAGRLQAAELIYRQILAADSTHADAWHLLGLVAQRVGKHQIAIEYIGHAIRIRAEVASFHCNLGVSHRALGQLDQAAACYRRTLELAPDMPEAHNNLGNVLKAQGKDDEAIACFRRAVELKPDYADAHSNLGNVLNEQGKLSQAVPCYHRALELTPDSAATHNNLGNLLNEQGKLDEALAHYRRALELKPDYAEAQNNLGNVLNEQGKPDEALACYQRALELKPDYPNAYIGIGNVVKERGKLDESLACYRRALELKPDCAAAHVGLGVVLYEEGNLDEARACYRRALELKPDHAVAHGDHSLLSLLTGDFQRGWPEYQWRWKTKQCPPRNFSQPLWDGQPLAGRTILLHAEQGFGDAIQFVRYAALVKQRGGSVIVECPRPLLALLRTCAGIARLVERGEQLPAFDVHAPLLSLPGIFHTSLENIPNAIPYLFADPALVQRWRQELAGIAARKIGIAWRGSPKHRNDRCRSIPLSCFEPLARLPGTRLVSLQTGPGAEELQGARDRFPVTDVGSRLEDFMDTAAVMMNLDLVIACDTAVVHLAGALGVPVWVALPLVPDWRWLLDRSDSPWYPTMRLFRQDRRGDWPGVFRRIEVAF